MRRLAIFLLGAITVAHAYPAYAHAHLKSASPAPKGIIQNAPPELTIDFTEELEPKFSSIGVKDFDWNACRQRRCACQPSECQAARGEPEKCCRLGSIQSFGTQHRRTPTRRTALTLSRSRSSLIFNGAMPVFDLAGTGDLTVTRSLFVAALFSSAGALAFLTLVAPVSDHEMVLRNGAPAFRRVYKLARFSLVSAALLAIAWLALSDKQAFSAGRFLDHLPIDAGCLDRHAIRARGWFASCGTRLWLSPVEQTKTRRYIPRHGVRPCCARSSSRPRSRLIDE